MMTVPTVHLNGSGRETLIRDYEAAHGAVDAAIAAVCDAAPNARDYYVQGPAAFPAAVAEHQARLDRLVAVRDELVALLIALVDA